MLCAELGLLCSAQQPTAAPSPPCILPFSAFLVHSPFSAASGTHLFSGWQLSPISWGLPRTNRGKGVYFSDYSLRADIWLCLGVGTWARRIWFGCSAGLNSGGLVRWFSSQNPGWKNKCVWTLAFTPAACCVLVVRQRAKLELIRKFPGQKKSLSAENSRPLSHWLFLCFKGLPVIKNKPAIVHFLTLFLHNNNNYYYYIFRKKTPKHHRIIFHFIHSHWSHFLFVLQQPGILLHRINV